ncbi:MAG: OmpA family protein [Bacteroidales bacterium]|nr:OmpA family protein [Bacteroidales bacterium]
MKKTFAIAIATCLGTCVAAQTDSFAPQGNNLVYNPSFEEYVDCPRKVDAHGILTTVQAWFQPTAGSADYYNRCGSKECGVPKNKLGVQFPRTGDGMCGIYCSKTDYREYLQTKLKEPLRAGETYRLAFHVSLSEYSAGAVATIGGLVTQECPADTGESVLMKKEVRQVAPGISQTVATYYQPQVQNNYYRVIANTVSWTEISGEFVAEGGERYLTIGNFLPASQSNVTDLEALTYVLPGAYYYVDDVSLHCLTCRIDNDDTVSKPPDTNHYTVGATFVLKDIYFAFDQSVLLQQSYVELQKLLETLRSHPTMRIEIDGHTDGNGSVEYNQRLSESRARAVVDYLISCGIDARRLESKGFGKSRPIDSNDTDEGRARNRRVEFKVLRL